MKRCSSPSRAMESQRPDALLKDERAIALVTQMEYDFARIKQIRMDEDDKVGVILRNREFDRYAWNFLTRCPEAVIVHIGFGARYHWVLKRGEDLECWGDGIQLLDKWFLFAALSRAWRMYNGCATFHCLPTSWAFFIISLRGRDEKEAAQGAENVRDVPRWLYSKRAKFGLLI